MADQSQTATQIKNKAVHEFDCMVSMLQKIGVEVIVVDHDNGNETPDAVFQQLVYNASKWRCLFVSNECNEQKIRTKIGNF